VSSSWIYCGHFAVRKSSTEYTSTCYMQYTDALMGKGVALAVTHPVYVLASIGRSGLFMLYRWEDSALMAELSKLLLHNVSTGHFRIASVLTVCCHLPERITNITVLARTRAAQARQVCLLASSCAKHLDFRLQPSPATRGAPCAIVIGVPQVMWLRNLCRSCFEMLKWDGS
jgi:hypothetical protein